MRWDVVDREQHGLDAVFLGLARKAIAANPSLVKPRAILAHHLMVTGQVEEALACLTESIARFPEESRFHLLLANLHHRTGQSESARQILERAPAVPVMDRETTLFRYELLMKLGSAEDLEKAASAILSLDPTNKEALGYLGNALRHEGRLDEMVAFCKSALELEPENASARYEHAVASACLGRNDEARALINLEQFVSVTEMVPPSSYADEKEFESAVAAEITRNPTLVKNPVDKATRGGRQTDDRLPHAGDRAIASVLDQVRSAVDWYERHLPADIHDAFVKRRPSRAWLNAWAVVYTGADRQRSHIHVDGWLSGVYYVSAPRPRPDQPRAGCLVLGSVDGFGANPPPWGLREIQPAPGRLVFFPSYIPHSTVPTQSTDQRICISFDVIPVKPASSRTNT